MNYETALALKDAGFKVQDKPVGRFDGEHHFMQREEFFVKDGKQVDVPTLSELIDACGEDFACISRMRGTPEPEHPWHALAWSDTDACPDTDCCPSANVGDTPEIAVANLYLSLHGKKD